MFGIYRYLEIRHLKILFKGENGEFKQIYTEKICNRNGYVKIIFWFYESFYDIKEVYKKHVMISDG